MNRLATLLLAGLLGLSAPAASAQVPPAAGTESSPVTELVLADGTRLVGRVVSESAGIIEFRTAGGMDVRVAADQVVSRRILRGRLVDGTFRPEDPNVSRLLFSATGRPVGKGRGYFADYYVFLPFLAYGVSDRVTLAGGVSLVPGATEQLVYVAPKVTLVNTEETALSAGMLAGTVTGEDEWGGILYAVGTRGNGDSEVSLGLGFLFGGGEVADQPIFMAGGTLRLGRTTKLISENYFVIEDGIHMLVSGGIRFFGERLAADLALMAVPEAIDDMEGFPFVPFVGFAYNFGR